MGGGVEHRLRTGEADFIVEHWPTPPRDVPQRRIGTVYGAWVVPSHVTAKGKAPLLGIGNLPFVSFPPASSEHTLQLAGLDFHGLSPPRLISASTVDAILGFVQAGLGYSLVPWPTRGGPKLRGVAATRVRMAGAVFPITASWLKSVDPNPLVIAALEAVSEH